MFIKFGPIIAMAEVKTVMPAAHVGHAKHDLAEHRQDHDFRPARTDAEQNVG